jgi:hypothetical protein
MIRYHEGLTSSGDVTYNATDYKSQLVIIMNLDGHNHEYFELLSQKLEQTYCINFNDTGYTEEEWVARFGDLPLDKAINEYAQKYELTPITVVL